MAPCDCKLGPLRQVESFETFVNTPASDSEKKPDQHRELGCRTSNKVISEEVGRTGAATSEMILGKVAGEITCQDRICTELKRPIVNEGQKITKYGSFESSQQQTSQDDAIDLQISADATKPGKSTMSAYFVGKNGKNFVRQEENIAAGECEESQSGRKTLGVGDDDDDNGQLSKPKRTRLERLAKHVPGLGIIMSLFASLFLGTAGMLVKLTTSVHGIEVAVMRAVIQLIIYSAIIGGRGIRWLPERPELIPVALRACLGGLSITLSYSALKLIPLGDATTIRFSIPIWTMIMGYFFLRESCSSFKVFAVAISISGVVLVTKPDMCLMLFHRLLHWIHLESSAELTAHELLYERTRSDELAFLIEAPLSGDDLPGSEVISLVSRNRLFEMNQTHGPVGVQQLDNVTQEFVTASQVEPIYSIDSMRKFQGCLMALGSSICLSISIIALRLCKRTSSEISIFWLSALSIVIGTLTLVAMDEWSVPNNWRDIIYILLNGVCGALGQWFMTNALKVEQSGVIALARTFDIEVAFLYSAFLLGEEIRMTSIFGSILVSLGVVSVVIPKWLGCGRQVAPPAVDHRCESVTTTPTTLPDYRSDTGSSHSSNSLDENHPTTMTSGMSSHLDGSEYGGQIGAGKMQQLVCVLSQPKAVQRQ